MPTIFDNIDKEFLPAIQTTLELSKRADFCVGYFNLRGWKNLDSYVDRWLGGEECCRLLIGMQRLPHEELREARSLLGGPEPVDPKTATSLRKRIAEEFRQQLMMGAPNNDDERTLRRLAAHLRAKKVCVKLFLRHPLHAKLYLMFRNDPNNPVTGYIGSSNLTFPGLSGQGELNIDVKDDDAAQKLARWFTDRWDDRLCIDISVELATIIEQSWVREDMVPPYQVYVKMAYHLSQEARSGLSGFRIPKDFGKKLFEFQTAAVKIAAHHLNRRNGVVIGDVVGLGKTLMATALARIFEDDYDLETLIICPKNLVPMWEGYKDQYRLRGKILSISCAIKELPTLRRYRIVLLDESHNLRNREGKRFRAIQEYVRANESKCILLSATPYNKSYLDLSSQLRLFVPEDQDLGVGPEKLLREIGETEFVRRHQCGVRTLAAFEHSPYPDDWRELMRLYMVRRTRSFIQDEYAEKDPATKRKFLTFEDGSKSYFPDRVPKTVKFKIDDGDPEDQYARLYSDPVVDAVNHLFLPRYGLGNFIDPSPATPPKPDEAKQILALSRAGVRLMGFCRTNLFKRLESSGAAFLQSVERHILRNYVFLHAIENGLPLPLGSQGAELLDPDFSDEDDDLNGDLFDDSDDNDAEDAALAEKTRLRTEQDFKKRAAEIYKLYSTAYKRRFKWLRSDLFLKSLKKRLGDDVKTLRRILDDCGDWKPQNDAKLNALHKLLSKTHPKEKVLVFTQFADTVHYLEDQLTRLGVNATAGVTGNTANPTDLVWRFSPVSNEKRSTIPVEHELRVLISTDILSEGQNLQDSFVVVNYDLPWAIIRLIQRVGRVDRIGQKADRIFCHSFLPAEGVERIIRLRSRVRTRLQENAEVVGADEVFFEDEDEGRSIVNLYNERAGILDGEDDRDVDLASLAYQIWKNAIDADPSLQTTIPDLPDVIPSSRAHKPTDKSPEGVLVYVRTPEGNDALAYVDKTGKSITESQFEILRIAACEPDTPTQSRHDMHHQLVKEGIEHIVREEKRTGGQLGRPSGARFRTYERLKRHADSLKGTLFESQELLRTIDEIYRFPLREAAKDVINRQLKSGIDDTQLAKLVMALRDEDRLCLTEEDTVRQEPRIICSMGLFESSKGR